MTLLCFYAHILNRLQVCLSPTSKCLSCNIEEHRRKLKPVQVDIIDFFFIKKNIYIRSHQRICAQCKECFKINKTRFTLFKTKAYSAYDHRVTEKSLGYFRNKIARQQRIIIKQQKVIKKLRSKLKRLEQSVWYAANASSKHKRNKFKFDNVDFEAYNKQFEKSQQTISHHLSTKNQSMKWLNRIDYTLCSNSDCLYWTGCEITEIVQQAKMCNINPLWIFHARVRLHQYLPYKLQSLIFGANQVTIRNNICQTFKLLNNNYAKPRLINSQPLEQQYWTRARVKQNTPNFVYNLLDIHPDEDQLIINQDSTYQYTFTCQTNHEIRKYSLNMHKHHELCKVHIFGCANGQPIYCLVCFGDGHHSDGTIWSACLDKKYVLSCIKKAKHSLQQSVPQDASDEEQQLRTPTVTLEDDQVSFKCIDLCKELLNLQELMKIEKADKAIMDNGYLLNDPRKMAPRFVPKNPQIKQQECLTVLESTYKRAIVLIRQTIERMNSWCKSNKMLRDKIRVEDIPFVQYVWNIALADMVRKNVILMKDDDNSETLTKRIIDMRYVDVNPARIWLTESQQITNTIQQNEEEKKEEPPLTEVFSQYEKAEDEMICKEHNKNTKKKQKNKKKRTSKDDNFRLVAQGWVEICHYLQTVDWLADIFEKIEQIDLIHFIGKTYQNKLAFAYIRRMAMDSSNLQLKIHKDNDKVFLLKNVQSKWKSSNKYWILISWYEQWLYIKSFEKINNLSQSIYLDEDELHWYNWMKEGRKNKVSQYLTQKYQDEYKILVKRRQKMVKNRKQYTHAGQDFGSMTKPELLDWAQELNIEIAPKCKNKTEIRDYILLTLRERDKEIELKRQSTNTQDEIKALAKEHAIFDKIKQGCNNLNRIKVQELKDYIEKNQIKFKKNIKKQRKIDLLTAIVKHEVLNNISIDDEFDGDTQRLNWIDDTKNKPTKQQIDESLHYMLDYPIAKSWWDLDFRLFGSSISRTQHACKCRTGQQLPGCCAHTSTFLWLFYCAIKEKQLLNKLTKISKRDANILNNVMNLKPYKKYQQENPHHGAKGCFCQQDKDEDTIHCSTCNVFYHPSCSKTKMEHIEAHEWLKEAFWCHYCGKDKTFMVKHS